MFKTFRHLSYKQPDQHNTLLTTYF